MEARDASGEIVQQPLGVMAVPQCAVGGAATVGVIALVLTVLAIRWGGWFGWLLGIILALVTIAGIGFFGFGLWGRLAGMPWTFGYPQ